ncbi:hypothetical protein SAMN04489859_1008124 [Paracoccus alcaliphilus]|uniref:N-acetyltransferase domain-containing protein n=1 Tax=Paracoccus alcaliphilus TaxID=34002 RepID=A0A1H8H5M7_9RHOB|nr:GNAT family protein [Paracoccus alcaliphilus]WCR17369.1 GNAT family N-acetyltransferase [Paracoccus alcaliphilus]SEN51320.1 hypothetical protein SAMN04489859_1008124 [Paracoccus alcaliphilus]
MIVTDARVVQLVERSIGRPIIPPYTCIGIEKDGQVIAGVVFNDFTGPDIHMTVGGYGWSRALLRAVGEYAFGQLGCLRISAVTEQEKVVALAERIGGRVEGHMRDLFGDGRDGVMIGFARNEWRYR